MKPNGIHYGKGPPAKLRFLALGVGLVLCLVTAGVLTCTVKPGAAKGREYPMPDSQVMGAPAAAPTLHEPPEGATAPISNATPAYDAGRQIHLDPVTGEIAATSLGARSAAQQLVLDQGGDLSSSAAGLVQVALTGVAGGVKVDLQGRFRSQVVATIGNQGELSVRCVPGVEAREGQLHEAATNAPIRMRTGR